ncbi:MAG: hypothetical protein LC754_15565 [Acidobacteria bacterium]|nr:hypothetical protein [Acidobacteriota bacterium]
MAQQDSYRAQWAEYRKRSIIVWSVFLTYIPGAIIIGGSLYRLTGSDSFIPMTAFAWMAAFAITNFYRMNWKCPRCGKAFFQKWWYGNNFARKCVHCGLPKWAESELDTQLKSNVRD